MSRIFFILLILTFNQLFAQGNADQQTIKTPAYAEEEVKLFTDRDLYLSGERIWFKAHCLYANFHLELELSKVLYVELYNEASNLKQKYFINNGISSGSIHIPKDFKTGNYYLRAYTQYLKNFNADFYFTKIISIINPNEPLIKEEKKAVNDSENKQQIESIPDKINESKLLLLNTNKEQFGKRELITLTIEPAIGELKSPLNLSVSVVKKGTILNTDLLRLNTKSEIENSNLIIKWIPDIRDVSISGIAYYKNTKKPVSNLSIYISAFKDPAQIHIIKTKQNGDFIYSLNSLKDRQDIFIGFRSENDEEIELQINNDFSTSFSNFKPIPLSIDSSYRLLIEEMNINHQAGNIYKTDPGLSEIAAEPLPFNFINPPVSVNLDKYINTPTLEMVFNELIPRCIVNKRQGSYFLTVVNDAENLLYKDPLVLIDNIPIFDMNELMKINPSQIEKIACYPLPFILGDNIIEGLVLINTRTENFGDIQMPEGSVFINYQTISTSNRFEAPLYDSEDRIKSRLADFRTTLYWNPQLVLADKKTIQFYSSDHNSEYDVIVMGFSGDGNYFYGKTSFSVKME